ncbi:MAG: ThiF family adenylyltransferase [Firmicutes bacterium]|nr:ThiF family adenylyltransferase [Bacillota bacterium]
MSRLAVVGVGATGGALLAGLHALGATEPLRLIDPDRVERSNLPRQPWFEAADIGRPKAEVMAERLSHGYRGQVEPAVARLSEENCDQLLDEVALVFDGTDNWPVREAIQAWAARHQKAWIYMSVLGLSGMTALFRPGEGPCLYCLFGATIQQGPHCFEAGVLGPVAAAVAGEALDLYQRWGSGALEGFELRLIDGAGGRTEVIRGRDRGCTHFVSLR